LLLLRFFSKNFVFRTVSLSCANHCEATRKTKFFEEEEESVAAKEVAKRKQSFFAASSLSAAKRVQKRK
jgi:hypothetical protein